MPHSCRFLLCGIIICRYWYDAEMRAVAKGSASGTRGLAGAIGQHARSADCATCVTAEGREFEPT